jgi:hypothetical protein
MKDLVTNDTFRGRDNTFHATAPTKPGRYISNGLAYALYDSNNLCNYEKPPTSPWYFLDWILILGSTLICWYIAIAFLFAEPLWPIDPDPVYDNTRYYSRWQRRAGKGRRYRAWAAAGFPFLFGCMFQAVLRALSNDGLTISPHSLRALVYAADPNADFVWNSQTVKWGRPHLEALARSLLLINYVLCVCHIGPPGPGNFSLHSFTQLPSDTTEL